MIKRIMSFKSDDWRHIFFLLKSAAKNFLKVIFMKQTMRFIGYGYTCLLNQIK